jgi:predicted dehydrogenase
MNPIKIGIIGAGQNTCKMHIPKLLALQGVEIKAVANRSLDSARKVAEQFNISHISADWREIATSKDIDAIVIGTWPYLHCEATCLALHSGKHVLCEARMSMNAVEAEKMLKVARENPHCIAQLVPSPFTLRIDETVKTYIQQGKLGKPLYFNFEYQAGVIPPAKAPAHWRRNKKYSGNNIMVLGIAYETILRWFDPAEWVSATASIFNSPALNPESGKPEPIEIPDYLNVQMKLKNGVMGSFLISESGLYARPPILEIFGDQGTLQYHFSMDGELIYGNNGKKQAVALQNPIGWRVEEEFINAIRGKEKVRLTTFETGVEYMKFTDAVNQSFKNDGVRITL